MKRGAFFIVLFLLVPGALAFDMTDAQREQLGTCAEKEWTSYGDAASQLCPGGGPASVGLGYCCVQIGIALADCKDYSKKFFDSKCAPKEAPTEPQAKCCCSWKDQYGASGRSWWLQTVCTARKGRCLMDIPQDRCITTPPPTRPACPVWNCWPSVKGPESTAVKCTNMECYKKYVEQYGGTCECAAGPACKKWMCAPSVPPATIPCYDPACVDMYVNQYGGFCECVEPPAVPAKEERCCCSWKDQYGATGRSWWTQTSCVDRGGRCLQEVSQRGCIVAEAPRPAVSPVEECCCKTSSTNYVWMSVRSCKARAECTRLTRDRCIPQTRMPASTGRLFFV